MTPIDWMLGWDDAALHKYDLIMRYALKFDLRTFVETGTFHGDMIEAVRHDFDHIYSIELSVDLYQKACLRFQNDCVRIALFCGDSGMHLGPLLKNVFPDTPALYWLDAHNSGGETAGSPDDSPLEKELDAIYTYRSSGIILIDDQHLTGVECVAWGARYPGFMNDGLVSVLDVSKGRL